MTASEVRRSFLDYFERNGHRIVPSSSLVPTDDPTLLFTNAGMNQFKDVFLGRERRDYTRATSSQKCMRVSGKHNDLDNVGPSHRHHTFFEMLGNFSFGDYFKKEAISYAWELLTDVWKLPGDRLYATVFAGEGGIPRDSEAHRHWQRFVPADRIVEFGVADNFWAMGDTGPCGRCSEVHYFRGNQIPCPQPVCQGLVCSCNRFIEVWNNVFMEFDRQTDGTLTPLPAPSIDTGMGLERIVAVLAGTLSNYDTDLFTPILAAIEKRAGVKYGTNPEVDTWMRTIADHIRAMTFLVADGVIPSNEWRGYVLRKIMRRAMRAGKRLYIHQPFLFELSDAVVMEMGEAYPELLHSRQTVARVVQAEEERFGAVLENGLPKLEALLATASADGTSVPGDEAFKLYDSLGMPLDFIEDLASQKHVAIDRKGFDEAMEGQRARARASSTFESKKDQEFVLTSNDTGQILGPAGDQFEGYTTTKLTGVLVLAVFDEERRQVTQLDEGRTGYAVLQRTPFYIESGGQVSDVGTIRSEGGSALATVEGLTRIRTDWPRAHRIRITSGALRERDLVTAEVDRDKRDATRRNHTATHLLHAALRQVLGKHVRQAGSLVAPDRLRFDFVHFEPLKRTEIDEIERLVNDRICRNVPVQTELRTTEEATASGAMALFGEKYGDRVRVVTVAGFSMELCGGTHCNATGDIGFFIVTQETGIAAGVRRIEACTGSGAAQYVREQRAHLSRLLDTIGAGVDQAVETIERLQNENKRLARENEQLRMKAALGGGPVTKQEDVIEVSGVRVITRRVEQLEKTTLRGVADALKERLGSGVVVLASATGNKVGIVVSVTKDLTDRVHAGQIVKQIAPIVGGGGGGRSDFAEAGGKNADKIDDMFAQARVVVANMAGGKPKV